MVTTSQEIWHNTENLVKLSKEYLGEKILLCCSMATFPCHIVCFELKYDKDFSKDPIFRVDVINSIHKQVQLFLHS